MSVKTTTKVWEWSQAEGNTRLVLLALADWTDDDGYCYPGIARISKKARVSERTTQRCLRELEDLGEVRVIPGAGVAGNGGITNKYQVVIKPPKGGDNLSGGDKPGTKVVTNQVKGGDTGDTQTVRDTSVDTSVVLTLEAPPESKSSKKFSPPQPQQVETYFTELGMNGSAKPESSKFCDHHGQGGWILKNGRKMIDWKCAARLWKSNWEKWSPEPKKTANLQSPDKTAELDQAFRTFLEGHENARLRSLFISKPYRSLSSIDLSSVSGEFGRWRRTGKYDSQGVAA